MQAEGDARAWAIVRISRRRLFEENAADRLFAPPRRAVGNVTRGVTQADGESGAVC